MRVTARVCSTLVLVGTVSTGVGIGAGAAGDASPRRRRSSISSQAVVVRSTAATPRELKAIAVLVEEVRARTQITLAGRDRWPAAGRAGHCRRAASARCPPASPAAALDGLARPGARGLSDRGQRVGRRAAGGRGRRRRARRAVRRRPAAARAAHGRAARCRRPPRGASRRRRPARIRGHQLGYRPKTNSYDGWTSRSGSSTSATSPSSAPTPSS